MANKSTDDPINQRGGEPYWRQQAQAWKARALDAEARADNDEISRTAEAALHMLHEQAHGDSPWGSCMVDPCRSLRLHDGITAAGPARSTLLGIGAGA